MYRKETFVIEFLTKESFDAFFDKYVRNPKSPEESGLYVTTAAIGDRVALLDECQSCLHTVAEQECISDALAEQCSTLANK